MTPRLGSVLAMLAVLAAAPLLAGCVGTAAATAMETRTPADEAAARWDPGAQLAQVVGLEGSLNLASVAAYMSGSTKDYEGGDYDKAAEDETIGDGRAEVWGYRYIASGKDMAYIVVVDREGTILREGEETRSSDFSTPIGAWSIDSDAALAIAKEANAALAKGVAAENFGIVTLLRHDPRATNPTWLVAGGGGSLSGAGGGYAEIDAVTGEVLASEGGFMNAEDWMRAWGGHRGS